MAKKRDTWTPGVRIVLCLVAVLPLLGIGLLSSNALAVANVERDTAEQISERTARLRDTLQFQADLTNEAYWSLAVESVSAIGVPLEVIRDQFDIDLVSLYQQATASTDRSLGALNDEAMVAELAGVRVLSAEDPTEVELAYAVLVDRMTVEVTTEISDLISLATRGSSSGDLALSLRVLESASAVRQSASEMNSASFGSRLPSSRSPALQAQILIEQHGVYVTRLANLSDAVAPDAGLGDALDRMLSEQAVVSFLANVDALTARFLDEGVADEVTFASLDLNTERQLFFVSLDAIAAHVHFVDLTASGVDAEATALKTSAEAERQATFATVVVMAAAVAGAILLGGWWIVRPLRRVAGAVQRLRDGDVSRHVSTSGPHEVRLAAAALNEAVDSISLAEQQAIALATEDLANPVLDHSLPGSLGASLQGAVSRLKESLEASEDFRDKLAHEATHDGLTGLLNRKATLACLEAAIVRGQTAGYDVAVLFVDFDGFKSVNDNHGHGAGDAVLQAMARRLTDVVRASDQVGRLGGDEFVVVAEPVRSVIDAMTLADRVLEAVGAPLDVDDVVVHPAASIGVALAGDMSDVNGEGLVRDADLALYKAKHSGRGRIVLCDDGLRDELTARLQIEQNLRRDIAKDRLHLLFQPIVDLDGTVNGLEALVRWTLESGEVVPPDDFIEIAERSDLIIDVDNWVLDRAVRYLAEWEDHPVLGQLRLSVNLSARHLAVNRFADHVLGPLETYRVDPRRLTIEITESALLNDMEAAIRGLDDVRSVGVQVAIDDFGTGYTSLNNLRHLPVDVLKVDRSFVANLDNQDDHSLVRLTIETGHLLGLAIVAEGVETVGQASELGRMGSDRLQGFLYSRPQTIEALLVDPTLQIGSREAAQTR